MTCSLPTQLPKIGKRQFPNFGFTPNKDISTLFPDVINNPNVNNIQEADRGLINNGYVFVGYHGTNLANLKNMMENGLDPKFCGSGEGEAKGSGLYIANKFDLAHDYSEASTQSGDPEPPLYETPRYKGDKGVSTVGRVYVKGFETLQMGKGIAWGLENSEGDPNGDKKISKSDTSTSRLKQNATLLEAVISPKEYGKIVIIPSTGSKQDEGGLSDISKWKSHER